MAIFLSASGGVRLTESSGSLVAEAGKTSFQGMKGFIPGRDTGSRMIGAGADRLLAVSDVSNITGWRLTGFIPSRVLYKQANNGSEVTEWTYGMLVTLVHKNEEMTEAAREVGRLSDEGMAYMDRLTSDTRLAGQRASETAERLERLKASTGSIETIVDMMEQLNKWTSILALNAGIEAARAGEAGRGFSVLAAEIRNLAAQSQESITVVVDILGTIRQLSDDSAAAFQSTRDIHNTQVESLGRANSIFHRVHEAMEIVTECLALARFELPD